MRNNPENIRQSLILATQDPELIEAFDRVLDSGSTDKLLNLLEKRGFDWCGRADECPFLEEDLESYKDFEISLDIPNGGIIAIDLIHRESQEWFSFSTTGKLDYSDEESIIAFAKKIIDEVEAETRETPGQLNLFGVNE